MRSHLVVAAALTAACVGDPDVESEHAELGGPPIRIAVLDTGMRAHPDLTWSPGRDTLGNGSATVDGADDGDPTDPGTHVHGVHVAGIIAGSGASGVSPPGRCPGCAVIPVRIAIDGTVNLDAMAQAIDWVANPGGARRAEVINMSFNTDELFDAGCGPDGPADPSTLEGKLWNVKQALGRARAQGVVLVAAAGNGPNGPGYSSARFPANCPGVISVGAAHDNPNPRNGWIYVRAGYSNHGANTTLMAPGGAGGADGFYGEGIGCTPPLGHTGRSQILSAWSTGLGAPCHRYLAGTSMASAYVAGVIGRMLQEDPTLTPAELATLLTATARKDQLYCPDAWTNQSPTLCGAGLVDAGAAIAAARNLRAPRLAVTRTSLDMGSVVVTGGTLTTNLVLLNEGNEALVVSAIVSSNAGEFEPRCTGGCAMTIPAGGWREIWVAFDPVMAGPRSAQIAIHSNDPVRPVVTVPAWASGLAPLMAFTPESHAFGAVTVGSAATRTITLTNSGDTGLAVVATAIGPGFSVSCTAGCGQWVHPGQPRTLTVTFAPTAAGAVTGGVALASNDYRRPSVLVPLSGSGVAPSPVEEVPLDPVTPPQPPRQLQ